MEFNRGQLTWFARCSIVAGAAMSVVFALSGSSVRSAITATTMLALIPIGVVARRVHRVPPAFAAGLGILGSVSLLGWGADRFLSGDVGVVIADAVSLTTMIAIVVMAGFLVSRRRGRLTQGDVLDGLIMASGAWLVSWIVFVRPVVQDDAGIVAISAVLSGLHLPVAVLLIAFAAILVVRGGRPGPVAVAVSVSLALTVAGDLLSAIDDVSGLGTWATTVAGVLFILAIACIAAGLVHPTARSFVGRDEKNAFVALPGRLSAVVAFQAIPLGLLTVVTATTTLDRVVRTLSAFVVLGLVSLRFFTASHSQVRAQQRLARAARTDELTDLPNKRALLEITATAVDDVWQSGHRPSLYLFDLDGFKNINDSLGHDVGDDLLVHIARRLSAAATSMGATASRPSGDEFVVFDPTPTSDGEAFHHAEVLRSVFNDAFGTIGGKLIVAASCGVASMTAGSPTDAGELFRWADIALYRAKATGRNKVVAFNASMSARVTARLEIEHSLRGAIDRRELHLFHQPIINIEDGTVSGLEALIRWRRPDGTLVPPTDFIGIAEETGQIDEIGAWAVLEALTQLSTWIDDGVVSPETTVSVNVSPRQLANPRFVGVVREALHRSKVPAHLLWLEITESVMADNPELAQAVLREIRATGVRIALDDFGTGYSSLSLLQQFPIQRIKIDQAFVSSLAENANDRTLVRTIIGLGDSMGVDIVAEGVETVLQLRMLRKLGCAKAQGFLISHPVPPEAMRSTITALDSLSEWSEFGNMLGESSLERFPSSGS